MPDPSWFSSISPTQIGSLPTSTLTGSGVDESGIATAIVAWGGACLVTGGVYNGASLIAGSFLFFGAIGGHTDSGLDGSYAYGPFEGSPQWYRPRDSASPNPTNVSSDASGNPVSRHVYGSLTYNSAANYAFYFGGLFRFSDAASFVTTHIFQFDTASPNSNQPWSTKANADSGGGGGPCAETAYEPSSNRVWGHQQATNEVQYFDATANTVTSSIFKSPDFGGNPGSTIDTSRGIWAIFGGTGGGSKIQFYRTNNGVGNDYYTPTTTGTAPASADGSGSIIYDDVDDRFVIWRGGTTGTGTLFYLTPPATNPYQGGNAWTWSSEAYGGSTPTVETGLGAGEVANSNGTYGRFAYWKKSSLTRGYVLLNRAGDPMSFFRPTSATGSAGVSMLASLGVG